MSDNAPAITVIMPVYNAEKYVAAALDSMLAQTLGEFEIIVVDDGSTDGSYAILREYASRDSRIRVLQQKNSGDAAARNLALPAIRGRYVAQQDADDVSQSTRLEKQAAFLDAHPDVCAVYCRIAVADENLRPHYVVCAPERDEVIRKALPRGNVLSNCSMVRADTYRAVAGYRGALLWSSDYDLSLRLTEVGKIWCIPEALYIVRKHAEQMSTTKQHVNDEYGALVRVFARERKMLGCDSYDELASARDLRAFIDGYRFRYEFYLYAGERTLRRLDIEPAKRYLRRAVALRPLSGKALALLALAYVPRFILQGVRSFKNRFVDRLGRTAPAGTDGAARVGNGSDAEKY